MTRGSCPDHVTYRCPLCGHIVTPLTRNATPGYCSHAGTPHDGHKPRPLQAVHEVNA